MISQPIETLSKWRDILWGFHKSNTEIAFQNEGDVRFYVLLFASFCRPNEIIQVSDTERYFENRYNIKLIRYSFFWEVWYQFFSILLKNLPTSIATKIVK